MSVIAVTGGTGFVGQHFLRQTREAGHRIQALTRREQDALPGVEWISGDLDDQAALDTLCAGADAVVHIAGAISAPDRERFAQANIEGTRHLLAACTEAGIGRFIHISSLAAREPALSLYGWSKAVSEALVQTAAIDATIIRPPAVYGPGDRETLELFSMAQKGRVVLPPPGRLSLIHVEDLCALFLACLGPSETIDQLYEPDDGQEGGISHEEFGLALGEAVGRKVRTFSIPAPLVRVGARLDRLFRGKNAKLTPDRAHYFCHPDWVSDPAKKPSHEIWQPVIARANGLAETAVWYREKGWLA